MGQNQIFARCEYNFFGRKSPSTRSNTVCISGSGQYSLTLTQTHKALPVTRCLTCVWPSTTHTNTHKRTHTHTHTHTHTRTQTHSHTHSHSRKRTPRLKLTASLILCCIIGKVANQIELWHCKLSELPDKHTHKHTHTHAQPQIHTHSRTHTLSFTQRPMTWL